MSKTSKVSSQSDKIVTNDNSGVKITADIFIDNFDMQPSDLPVIYGSIEKVKTSDIEKLRRDNKTRSDYMKKCNDQMDAFGILIKEQQNLNDELNKIDITKFVTKETLQDFVEKHNEKVSGFTDDLESVVSLVKENREKFIQMKQINDDIENDQNLKKLIYGVNAACNTYKQVLNIISGTQ